MKVVDRAVEYREFLEAKVCLECNHGFECSPGEVNSLLKPHQRDIVCWAVRGGRRAVFTAFGLGKTVIQLEIVRLILLKAGGGRGLIVLPLGVRQEFRRDARMLGTPLTFIRTTAEASADGLYMTNYESVREGKLDPTGFTVVSLDEAAVLRGFGGTKTFREFMGLFAGDEKKMDSRTRSAGVPYRFVATATPSPNEFIELLAYSAFLGILEVGQGKTRFFKRNSEKADALTLHKHKEAEFWMWVSSWAIFLQKPSDLGHPDDGYEMPVMDVRWHEVASDFTDVAPEKGGQGRMFRSVAIGVQDSAREKRESLPGRITKLLELRAEDPGAHRILWHDLEAEREAIEWAVPGAVSVYGSQDLDEREAAIVEFSEGRLQELAAKPVMLGSGCNLQRHCHWAIFLGIGFKFSELIQAIHRIQRFLQTHQVRIDLIYTEAEREIRKTLERKWAQHIELVAQMTAIIREYGLSGAAMAVAAKQGLGVERSEVSGRHFTLVNNDCVEETRAMKANSVGLVLTSVPFGTQYQYSMNYADFGHTDNNDHFWRQMDFLTPELFRVLQPGRIAAVHVKDRIVPGGLTGLGFQTVYPFSDETRAQFCRHGFAFIGRISIITDVVRENNQTYRLGWSEQCKDGSKMGNGLPEYLLLFRKPPTDTTNSYADLPVVKGKAKYSRSRWQIDAHGFHRSSGNRLIHPDDLRGLRHEQIFKLFRKYSLENVYDFENHVALGEALEERRMLPVTFMLLQPQSWHEDVWSDITRMRTLNGAQSAKGKEMHLAPLQFDIVDRAITRFSNPGETVYDPFCGLGTTPYRAVKLGRRGLGVELSPTYFYDSVFYCQAAERELATPSLFDLDEDDGVEEST
ncbi:MAG: DNA methyltransferase [Sulfuritalea sp.]|nr:DNA methyltransferase [Sulfuritalea sp.]